MNAVLSVVTTFMLSGQKRTGKQNGSQEPSIRIALYTYKQVRALSSVVYKVSST